MSAATIATLAQDRSRRPIQHVIDVASLPIHFVEAVMSRAERLKHERNETLRGKSLCWIAQQPSTRTGMSFKAAMTQLGGTWDNLPDFEHSSESKGESPPDTIRVVGAYHDLIVIRAKDAAFPLEAAKLSAVPIINAGNGPDEHPTQFLLDSFTIKQKFGRLEGLTIVVAGDIAKGRAPRSLIKGFAEHFPHNRFVCVSPPELKMGDDVRHTLHARNVQYTECKGLDEEILSSADVVYLTRLQREHHKGYVGHHYPRLSKDLALTMRRKSIIMHPLPADRGRELPYEIDDLPQAVYLTDQLVAGLTVRKALLQQLLLS